MSELVATRSDMNLSHGIPFEQLEDQHAEGELIRGGALFHLLPQLWVDVAQNITAHGMCLLSLNTGAA
jgi:hypothetical protein